jgi:lactoylglutathione lyase
MNQEATGMDKEMGTPANIRLLAPFFLVTDMEKSLQFYIQGLGFKITNQWTPRGKIEWCWLERELVALMLQEPAKKDHLIHTSPAKKGFGVSITFQCQDALALYHEFKNRSLNVSDPFVGNGMWVFQVHDPDGYLLEFESLTDVPEETNYKDWFK